MDHPADGFVVSLTGGNLLRGTARPRAGGGSDVVLDDGVLIHADAHASGRVNVAVYPWEVSVHAPGAAASRGTNAITAPICALTPEEGHVRVRIGAVTAESSRDELDRLGLARGCVASARFSPAHARLIAIEPE